VLEAFVLLRGSEAGRIVNVSDTIDSLADRTDPASPYFGMGPSWTPPAACRGDRPDRETAPVRRPRTARRPVRFAGHSEGYLGQMRRKPDRPEDFASVPEFEGVPAEEDLDEADAADRIDEDAEEQRNFTDPRGPGTGDPDAPERDDA
jgi:hypothetical protein